ncbi:hypothetical protein ABZ686_20430 [Streptomyces sp. NPDC006992]|uniref:hypothetical protein n=1 Tax=unclassified Streptomyces TaxID=2593676 RepID=UPI0033D49224
MLDAAGRSPDAVALRDETEEISYARLVSAGAGPGTGGGSIGTVHSRLTAPFPAVLCGPARPPEAEDAAPCGAAPGTG